MISQEQRWYYLYRARLAAERAADAQVPVIAAIHQELHDRYVKLADGEVVITSRSAIGRSA